MNVPIHVAAVREAVEKAGGDAKLADILLDDKGVRASAERRLRTQWKISKWKSKGAPPVDAVTLARLTGVPLSRLCPPLAREISAGFPLVDSV